MTFRRHRKMHPIDRLVVALNSAAIHIHVKAAREIAGRDAERIPVSNMERGAHPKAEIARTGRRMLRDLANKQPDELADAKSVLTDCANALASRFEETSFQQLGKRRRGDARPAP